MFKKASEDTKKYHQNLYTNKLLFEKGSWLEQPERVVLDTGRKLTSKNEVNILDLGSGVGRNVIPLIQILKTKKVLIECVDYLDIAIKKLLLYAKKYKVETFIKGYVAPVEDFKIKKDYYDFIISHGVLAHVRNKRVLNRILSDIERGVKKGGFVYLAITSDLREEETDTKKKLKPLVEIYLESKQLKQLLKKIYKGWEIDTLDNEFYSERLFRKGKEIKWSCNFVILVARKM